MFPNYYIIVSELTGLDVIEYDKAMREDVARQSIADYRNKYPGKRIILANKHGKPLEVINN